MVPRVLAGVPAQQQRSPLAATSPCSEVSACACPNPTACRWHDCMVFILWPWENRNSYPVFHLHLAVRLHAGGKSSTSQAELAAPASTFSVPGSYALANQLINGWLKEQDSSLWRPVCSCQSMLLVTAFHVGCTPRTSCHLLPDGIGPPVNAGVTCSSHTSTLWTATPA